MSLQVSPLWPLWLTLAVLGALFLATAYGLVTLLRKQVRPRWVLVLTGLRLAVLVVVALIVLQPVLSYRRTVEPLPEVLVLVDTAHSMGQPGGTAGTSRLDEGVSALRQGDLAAALHDRFRLRWFRYDRTAAPVREGELAHLKPAGAAARLAEGLAGACDLLHAEGSAPERVLLVSDGNDQGEADPAEVARKLGVAVDVLPPGGTAPTWAGPIEIADAQGARRVLLGSETHFRVAVRGGRPADQDRPLSLHLFEDGKKIQDVAVTLRAGRAEQSFTLAHRPGSTGLKQYAFRLQAPGGKAGPPKKLSVRVVDGKYEILLLEDTWRWEYRFLHRLFEDDPSVRFTALLSRGKGYVQFASPDRRVGLVGFPQGRAELEGFDLFFLGDVNPARWPPGLAADLAQLVTEEGKSLVVLAGPGLGRLADVPELHALLPVDLTRDSGSPVAGPVDVRLRADAAPSPFFFQLRPGETALPALDQVYPVLRKRPGATVLLEAAKQRNAYGNLIVLAEHTVGRGRVLFVGTDTLWKWQTLAPGDGPTPYSIFWQQALRALTPRRTRLGPVSLWLTPSWTRGEIGRRLEVEAEVQSDRPLPGSRLQATAELPDGRRLPLVFAPDPANPRRFRAELSPPLPGLYKVNASLLLQGKSVAAGTTSFEVEGTSAGQRATGVDRLALARLAAATGGRVIDPSRPETWPVADGKALPAVEQTRTFDLWSSFTLLFVLCGLLGTDWLVRLVKGLV